MIIKEHHILHLQNAHHEHTYRQLDNGITFRSDIVLCTSTFLEYQKDIIQEGIGNLIEDLSVLERPETRDVKGVLERDLQVLNSSLRAFSSKVKQQNIHFDIVGSVQIIIDREIIASLIGPSSAVIIRDHSIYYKIDNTTIEKDICDVFSDFVEGELEQDDQLLVFGYPLSQVIDRDDIKEINELLKSGQDPLTFIQDLILTRIGVEQLIISTSYSYHRQEKSIRRQSLRGVSQSKAEGRDPRSRISEEVIRKNKFTIVVSLLGCVILALMYNLLRTAFVDQSSEQSIETGSGVVVITIEDIKREIAQFQRIDPTSNAKKDQYNAIMEKLTLLESNKRRPDDVKKLKDILITEYNLGFNITPLSKLLNSSLASQMVELSAQDIQSLGKPLAISFDRTVNIAGASSALLGVVSNDIKGSAISYNIPQLMNGCFQNPQKNGFYCVSSQGDIYNIGKAGIETVTSKSGKFPSNVVDIAARGKGNLFLLVNDPTLTRANNFIVKYTVVQGKQHEYQEAQPYTISNQQQSGQVFGSGFSSLGIDGNFSVRDRSRKALVQLRRDRIRTNPTLMTSRVIQLFGGDKDRMPFSDNVKVLTFQNTEDVYLFDRTNQTLTVYKSNPTKKNDTFWTTYNLNYQYRVIFDQTENPVIDVAIAQPGGKTEAYLLTQRSVIKVSLIELGQPVE